MPRRPSFSIDRSNAELVGVQLEIEPIEDGQLVQTLVACVPYFGTGHEVVFGLGQTRSG